MKYVEDETRKKYTGFISALYDNTSKYGFIASASASYSSTYGAYQAFSNYIADTTNKSWVSNNTTTKWVQIQCPDAVKIWRVALKSRAISGRNITGWALQGSNDAINFIELTNSTNSSVALLGADTTCRFFNVSTSVAYKYYRLNITQSTGPDVGVSVLQLYTLAD